MRHPLLLWLAVCAVWLVLVGAGCNLFEPDDPEPPSEQAILPDYRTPDRTLDMIALALRDKARTNGTSVYIGAFADSTAPDTPAYHHFFWPTDVAQSGVTPPADWGVSHELNFYSKLLHLRGDEYQLIWLADEENPDDTREQRVDIHRHYEVVTETPDGTITGTLALGFADLTLVKGADGNWRVTIWSDRVDPAADPGADEVSLGRRRLSSP